MTTVPMPFFKHT